MNQNRDKLGKVEMRLKNGKEREGKYGALTPYQNDRYLTSTQFDVLTFDGHLNYSDHSDPQLFLDCL